mmetsp:Transcript_14699/g.20195  ORF Transcript_14699/g.20195 Transcript_14699/m.20195 type:complete len:528 (+) Transcript_14699:268-1851(+)
MALSFLVEAQLATTLTIVGAWAGCLMGSLPAEKYGRKTAVLGNNLCFIVGAAIAATGNVYGLFIGKLISGVGVGVASVVPPVLLSEIATAETRGTITTLHQAVLTLAIFTASVLGYGMVTYVSHGWQYVQAFEAFPAVVMLLLYRQVPESPKWLLANTAQEYMNNRRSAGTADAENSPRTVNILTQSMILGDKDQVDLITSTNNINSNALSSQLSIHSDSGISRPSLSSIGISNYQEVVDLLRKLRPAENFHFNVDREILSLLADAKKDAAISENAPTWAEVFACRKAVVIGCGLMFFQAITGVNSVFFYSTTIFNLAGFSQSIIGTAIVGAVNFLVTLLSTHLIDKFGRKVLLTSGTYIMLVSLVTLSSVLLSNAIAPDVQGLVAVFAVVLFVVGFAFGLGAVCWVIMSEIMPTRLRSKAMSLFLSINWACNLLIGFLTLTAIDGLGGVQDSMDDDEKSNAEKKGVACVYFIFAGFTMMSIIFMTVYVPETKGKSVEELLADNRSNTVYSKLISNGDVSSSDHSIS